MAATGHPEASRGPVWLQDAPVRLHVVHLLLMVNVIARSCARSSARSADWADETRSSTSAGCTIIEMREGLHRVMIARSTAEAWSSVMELGASGSTCMVFMMQDLGRQLKFLLIFYASDL